MLVLTKFIGMGATRVCFEHPEDSNACIKVEVKPKRQNTLYKEISNYFYIKAYLPEYLPLYYEELIQTNLGLGLGCQLIKDENGQYSKSLAYYYKKGDISEDIINQLWHFAYCLIEHDIFFYDFNLKNFVIQIVNNKKMLKYIDLKSYNNYKPLTFLRLEKFITPLAKYVMIRRLKGLLVLFSGINN